MQHILRRICDRWLKPRLDCYTVVPLWQLHCGNAVSNHDTFSSPILPQLEEPLCFEHSPRHADGCA